MKWRRRQIVARTAGVVLMAGALIAGARQARAVRHRLTVKDVSIAVTRRWKADTPSSAAALFPAARRPPRWFRAAHMSLMTLDGAGNLTDRVTLSGNGEVSREVAQGTYTINADCRGELTIQIPGPPFQLTWDLVVAELQGAAKGKEFYAIGTVPGAVDTFTANPGLLPRRGRPGR